MPVFTQPLTAGAAHSGGSVMDRNRPPGTEISEWAATRANGSPSARRASGRTGSVALASTSRTRSAPYGPGSRSAVSRITADKGSRRRTSRPASCPSGPVRFSSSTPPGTVNGTSTPPDSSSLTGAVTCCSRSAASSHGAYSVPPTRSDPTSAQSGAARTVRRCSWRNRTVTVSSVAALPSRMHSVWLAAGSPGSTCA